MEKEYQLWKITEKHTTGCPEDESESSTYKTRYELVPQDKADEFGESISDDYGNQDYGYGVNYTQIATISELGVIFHSKEETKKITFSKSTMVEISKAINKVLSKNICKYCGENETGSSDEDILCDECAESFGHTRYSEL